MTDIAAIREMIERQMSAKGFSRRSLSSAAGLSESAVRDLLTRTADHADERNVDDSPPEDHAKPRLLIVGRARRDTSP